MTEKNTENMQVSGMVSGGKSGALIRYLAERPGPGDVAWAIDAKAIITASAHKAARKTHVFNATGGNAATGGAFDERCPVVLVVDECQALLADPAMAAATADLIHLGRAGAQAGAVEGDRR